MRQLGVAVVALVVAGALGCEKSVTISAKQCVSFADTTFRSRLSGEYDEFADTTTVTTASSQGMLESYLGAVTGDTEAGISPIAVMRCAGEGVCRPDSVSLYFYRSGSSRQLSDSASVIFLLNDRRRVRLGPAEVQVESESFLNEVIVNEVATLEAPYGDFVEIACADSARFQVGDVEDRLQENERALFRHLIGAAEGKLSLAKIRESETEERQKPASQTATEQDTVPTSVPPKALTVPSWMNVDRWSQSVTMEIVAGETPANNNWNYNGYHSGKARIVVPKGYQVTVNFENRDDLSPHSLAIDRQIENYPPVFDRPRPAFEGAVSPGATSMPDATQPGQSESITFTASEVGDYAIVCYLPGHATAGMWIRFTVSSEDRIGLTKP